MELADVNTQTSFVTWILGNLKIDENGVIQNQLLADAILGAGTTAISEPQVREWAGRTSSLEFRFAFGLDTWVGGVRSIIQAQEDAGQKYPFSSEKAMDAFETIVDVTERAGLLSVTPNLDLPAIFHKGDFSGKRGRSLLAATLVRAVWSVDVVEADGARLETIFTRVVLA